MKTPELIEQVIGAFRERDADGRIQASPAWHDLAEDERETAFQATVVQRKMEAALDADGLSSTARAVLARIMGS